MRTDAEEYKDIPILTIDTLQRYVEHHIPTGGFLEAVLTNDLFQAFARADIHNRRAMFEICKFIWCELPFSCWGSKEKVEAWLAKRKTE